MNPRRLILFLGVCIVIRLTLAYIAWQFPDWAQRLSLLALGPVIGWLWIHFISGRESGPEVFGGKIWWDYLRPAHAMLWALFSYYAYHDQYKHLSWIPLFIDTMMGLVGWTHNYLADTSLTRSL